MNRAGGRSARVGVARKARTAPVSRQMSSLPLDFSSIDLSEFTAEIMANIKMPNVGTMSQQIQSTVQQKVQNYYQR